MNSKGEIILVEIQNTRELHYLERILYGVAKAITEHISIGEGYGKIKKVYSISILYFDIGIGTDYIYHGQNHFVGVHTGDYLRVNTRERDVIVSHLPAEIFPRIYPGPCKRVRQSGTHPFGRMDRIPERRHDPSRYDCTGSEGSPRELKYYSMSPQERLIYDRHLDAIMIQNDVIDTAKLEGRIEGKAEGLAEGMRQVASRMKDTGVDVATIVKCTGLSEEIALSL